MLIDFVRRQEQGGVLFAGQVKFAIRQTDQDNGSKPKTETVMTGRKRLNPSVSFLP